MLTLYYTGKFSLFSKDSIEQAYSQEKSMIEMGFGSLPSNPIVAEDRSFVSYQDPVGYSWPNDPYARGSYSYIAPGQESLLTATHQEMGETVKTLFSPIDQKLYFVGEHTSTLMEFPGTMEAACESGERAARMILDSFRNDNDGIRDATNCFLT